MKEVIIPVKTEDEGLKQLLNLLVASHNSLPQTQNISLTFEKP